MNGATFRTSCAIFLSNLTSWPGLLLSDKTTERREGHYSADLCEEAARVKNLKVVCPGSRINKVGPFSLCNKDDTVLSEKFFFFQDAPFSPALPF